MINLTPEKRAELREQAESARPFVRHGGIDPAWTHVLAADLLTLLDAADERDGLADALVRAHGPFPCCPHCKEDTIHDVEMGEHEVPCTKCQASVGEIERLRSERDRLAAQVQRVREVAELYASEARHEPYGGEPWSTTAAALNAALNGKPA